MIGLGWLAYVRTDYRDLANSESHNIFKFGVGELRFKVKKAIT